MRTPHTVLVEARSAPLVPIDPSRPGGPFHGRDQHSLRCLVVGRYDTRPERLPSVRVAGALGYLSFGYWLYVTPAERDRLVAFFQQQTSSTNERPDFDEFSFYRDPASPVNAMSRLSDVDFLNLTYSANVQGMNAWLLSDEHEEL